MACGSVSSVWSVWSSSSSSSSSSFVRGGGGYGSVLGRIVNCGTKGQCKISRQEIKKEASSRFHLESAGVEKENTSSCKLMVSTRWEVLAAGECKREAEGQNKKRQITPGHRMTNDGMPSSGRV